MSDVEGTAGDRSGTVMNRRALLRAGGVVAGIAGIGTYAAASAPSAGAASGDPVLMGAANDAGTADTVVTTAAFAPTLLLSNTGSGAPLRLGERTSADLPTADSGDLLNDNGDLLFAHGPCTDTRPRSGTATEGGRGCRDLHPQGERWRVSRWTV